MDKLILKKIAKRYAKSVLLNTQASVSFDGILTENEAEYIGKELIKIANKITVDEDSSDVESLVKEYYNIEQ